VVAAAPPQRARKPEGFKLPQIIVRAVARRGRRGWTFAFTLPRLFRLIEATCLVAVPDVIEEGAESPVFVRFWIDRSQEDRPGTATSSGLAVSNEDDSEE
jgi:hypothetical protein